MTVFSRYSVCLFFLQKSSQKLFFFGIENEKSSNLSSVMQKTGLNSSPNEKKNFTLNEDDAEQNKYNDEMINTFTIELAHTSYLSKKKQH